MTKTKSKEPIAWKEDEETVIDAAIIHYMGDDGSESGWSGPGYPDQPSRDSSRVEGNIVILENCNGELVRYRIKGPRQFEEVEIQEEVED